MHQIIDEILGSTKNRIPSASNKKKSKITSRQFKRSIEDKKKKGLIPVISEVKPSSPTRFIRNVTPQDASEIAIQMESAGAAAISVLTEPFFFKGSIQNLISVRDAVKIPVLRKDFIINKNQIHEIDSDLILLIAGILGDELDDFVNETLSSGREPLVEVHNSEELKP
jgi:indole-3-glycerol phosphate synthase